MPAKERNNMLDKIAQLTKSINVFEIVLTTVVSVAIGVAFWGWTYVSNSKTISTIVWP